MAADLLHKPLRLALLVLWLTGLYSIARWPLIAPLDLAWVTSTCLAGLVTLLAMGNWRQPWLAPLAIILGLAGVVGIVQILGGNRPGSWLAATVIYVLGVWLVVDATLTKHLTRLVGLAGWTGGWGPTGGRRALRRATHYSALFLSILAVGTSALLPAAGAPSALVLVPALLFWARAAHRYRSRAHAYLLLVGLVWGIFGSYAALPATGPEPGLGAALSTALASLGIWPGLLCAVIAVMARALATLFTAEETKPGLPALLPAGVYRLPLLVTAVLLSLIALGWLLAVPVAGNALGAGPTGSGWLEVLLLATSAVSLIGAGQPLARVVVAGSAAVVAGVTSAALALWGAYGMVFPGVLPWQVAAHGADTATSGVLWLGWSLVVALLCLVASCRGPGSAWRRATRQVALVGYGMALIALVGSVLTQPRTDYALLAALLVLGSALFPLTAPGAQPTRPMDQGAWVRGVVLAGLVGVIAWATSRNGADAVPALLLYWAFGLWTSARFLLPWLGRRWPQWAVDPAPWPWVGLVLVATILVHTGSQALLQWPLLLGVAGYLWLMAPRSGIFPWGAALCLGWSGFGFALAGQTGTIGWHLPLVTTLAVDTLLWANLLLLAAYAWERWGKQAAALLHQPQPLMPRPLRASAACILLAWLVALGLADLELLGSGGDGDLGLLPAMGLLLSLSLLHLRVYERGELVQHGLLLALTETWVAFAVIVPGLSLAPSLAGWGLVLFLLPRWFESLQLSNAWDSLSRLLPLATLTSLAAAVIVPEGLAATLGVTTMEAISTLAIVALVASTMGWRGNDHRWAWLGAWCWVVLAHVAGLLLVRPGEYAQVLPWAGLASAGAGLGLDWWSKRRGGTNAGTGPGVLQRVWWDMAPWLMGLAFLHWALTLVHVVITVSDYHPEPVPIHYTAAALGCAGLLVYWVVRQARRTGEPRWVYTVVALVGSAGLLLRLSWLGLAPLTVWDTAAVLGAACAVLWLQAYARTAPLGRLSLALPILALLTVPLQTGSAHTAVTLLIIGALYLQIRRLTHRPLALWLGVLAIDAGLYIWLWNWGARSGLFQVYLVPAAVTVLVLLHLHRREIKPSVLNSGRLAALSLLYAAGLLDVFLRPEIGVFLLALGLSLSGVLLGIALRIRAFLYSGIAFLLLNLGGQLFQLYPEQRLERALVLLALGTVITAAMIGFNLKREAIMGRIRVFRADLETWH